MKLFRVTVERTERAVLFVQAEDRSAAEDAAIKAAGGADSDYWQGEGFDIYGVRTVDDEQRVKIQRRDPGYQYDADAYVENGQDGITVGEWLEAAPHGSEVA